jgi:dienelactone hydrolase
VRRRRTVCGVVVESLIVAMLAVARPPERPPDVQGTYFRGGAGAPVVVWGGSSGRPPDALAARLAAAGHPALSVRYFGRGDLPHELARVPLEYFARAIRVLDRQPGVDGRRMVVLGSSRGSEAALHVAAAYPRLVHGVIVTAPSSKAYSAPYDLSVSAWTYRGREVPYARLDGADPATEPRSVIPVERIRGPVLLGAGANDAFYDSAAYAAAIVRRLRRRRFGFRVRSVVFPHAGHSVADRLMPDILRFLDQI